MHWTVPPTLDEQFTIMYVLLPAIFVLVGLLALFAPSGGAGKR